MAYPHAADSRDHTDEEWNHPWLGIGWANNKQVAWRHAGGADFLYVDGHVKYAHRGTIRDEARLPRPGWDLRRPVSYRLRSLAVALFHQILGRVQGHQIAVRAETDDLAGRDGRDDAVAAKLLAGVDI